MVVNPSERDERARRLLELAVTRSGGDGAAYARAVFDALKLLEGAGVSASVLRSPRQSKARVVETAVEGVLLEVRDGAYSA